MNQGDTSTSASFSASSTLEDVDNMSLVIEDEDFQLKAMCAETENATVNDDSGIIEDETVRILSTHINDLPDEVLENIFTRVSPYNDFDNIKCVCRKWNSLAQSKWP